MKKQNGILIALLLVLLLGGCSGKTATEASSISPTLTLISNSPAPNDAASPSLPSTTASPASTPASTPATTPASNEKPVAPEKNPTGDISDSQVFIKYSSVKGGYSLEVPEGWARKEQEATVDFIDKLDGVKVTVDNAAQAPTADSIKISQAADLKKSGLAIKINSIQEISLSKEKVIKMTFSSNSEADSVTGKQIRLDNVSYYFYKNGKLATLTMWAPLGADNIDQWNKMSESFRWDTK
jgi:hypothetical protein